MTQRTDKELLELAAKAYGLEGYEYVEATEFTYASMQRRNYGGAEDGFFELQADVWSPLTDDGDVLRLAVKMRLKIDIRAAVITVEPYIFNQDAETTFEFFEDNEQERLIATRRAIVRAAAEIGAKL